jgi:peptidoglycan hydrolase-like protein with peptidoglycan-binding domain
MNKRTWLYCLGAVLIASAPPVLLPAVQSAAAHSSVKKKKAALSKKKAGPTAHGQTVPAPARIVEIQSALKREGALEEEPTGKWGNTTVEAMKKYQGSHGLNPTGKIDALTLQKLGLGSETAGKGAPTPSAPSAGPPSKATR